MRNLNFTSNNEMENDVEVSRTTSETNHIFKHIGLRGCTNFNKQNEYKVYIVVGIVENKQK